MTTPFQIHVSAVDRLYDDAIITDDEYKRIMNRLILANIKEKEAKQDG